MIKRDNVMLLSDRIKNCCRTWTGIVLSVLLFMGLTACSTVPSKDNTLTFTDSVNVRHVLVSADKAWIANKLSIEKAIALGRASIEKRIAEEIAQKTVYAKVTALQVYATEALNAPALMTFERGTSFYVISQIKSSESGSEILEIKQFYEDTQPLGWVNAEDTAATAEEAKSPYKVIDTYVSTLPEEIVKNLKYDRYEVSEHYVVLLNGTSNIRSKPGPDGSIIKKGLLNEKFAVSERVEGQKWSNSSSNLWYNVSWEDNGQTVSGYITEDLAVKRAFQFDKMTTELKHLEMHVNNNRTGYVNNFRDSKGAAPLYKGAFSKDDWGILRYQSAPAYDNPSSGAAFRYVQDGKLVDILEEVSGYFKVYVIDLRDTFYIPKKYISENNSIKALKQVIVVDRKNQNEGVFEKIDGEWNLISNIYATTGADDEFRYPTELGSFMIIYKKDKFLYLDDVTKELAGYAPFAVRFNGGAFIHGVPIDYTLVRKEFIVKPEVKDLEGNIIAPAVKELRVVERIDPGMRESMASLGTVPRSHKCVRNYTSHAKFIYDWVEIGAASVVVIE